MVIVTKDMDGSLRSLIWGNTQLFVWRYWGKQATSVTAAGLRSDIQTQNIQNSNQAC